MIKAFDKTQLPFLVKTLKKIGIRGYILNKRTYIQISPNASILFSNGISTKIRNKALLKTVPEVLASMR